MKRLLKNKLIGNTLIFTISTILNKGMNFFLLPILTFYLSKSDYGHLGFIVSVVAIASIYIGLWPSNFIMAKFSSFGKEKMSLYMYNIFIITFVTFLLVLGVMFAFENSLFVNFENRAELIVLISVYTLFVVIFNIFNTIIQLEKNALKYALFQSIYMFSSLGLALLLIIVFHFDWHGKFYAELFVLSLLCIYIFYYLIKEGYLRFSFDLDKLRELFSYLFPMTFHVIGLFLMGTADKVFLAKYLNLEVVGIYTIAMTMSIIVNIVYDSAIKAWEPYFFEKIATGKQADMNFILKSLVLYEGFVIVAAFVYIQLVPYIFAFMINAKFDDALAVIPLLVIGFSFEGLRKPLASFLMHKNKVKTLGVISFIAAFINIGLNIVLIQKYGINGAAYATIAAFSFLYVVTFILVFKYYDLTSVIMRWRK